MAGLLDNLAAQANRGLNAVLSPEPPKHRDIIGGPPHPVPLPDQLAALTAQLGALALQQEEVHRGLLDLIPLLREMAHNTKKRSHTDMLMMLTTEEQAIRTDHYHHSMLYTASAKAIKVTPPGVEQTSFTTGAGWNVLDVPNGTTISTTVGPVNAILRLTDDDPIGAAL